MHSSEQPLLKLDILAFACREERRELGENIVVSTIERGLEFAAYVVDVVGVLVVLLGFAIGLVGFVAVLLKPKRELDQYVAIQHARCSLGMYLLFGLELMIASDVLRSIVSRSLEDLALLGVLVVIRTVIAYFLGREIEEIRAG